MPCDQVRTTTTEWGEATDLALVARAMESLEYESVRVDRGVVRGIANDHEVMVTGGKLVVRSPRGEKYDDTALRQRYAAEVVRDRFTAMGWDVQEQGKARAVAGFTREW